MHEQANEARFSKRLSVPSRPPKATESHVFVHTVRRFARGQHKKMYNTTQAESTHLAFQVQPQLFPVLLDKGGRQLLLLLSQGTSGLAVVQVLLLRQERLVLSECNRAESRAGRERRVGRFDCRGQIPFIAAVKSGF